MRFTEDEYRKYIFGIIAFLMLLMVLLIGLTIYTYRTPLSTGEYIKGKKGHTTYQDSYTEDGMYMDYTPTGLPTHYPEPSGEIPLDPENRKF